MDMFDEEVVLCASRAYEKKFYLNEEFSRLPEDNKHSHQSRVTQICRSGLYAERWAVGFCIQKWLVQKLFCTIIKIQTHFFV